MRLLGIIISSEFCNHSLTSWMTFPQPVNDISVELSSYCSEIQGVTVMQAYESLFDYILSDCDGVGHGP